MSKIVTEDNYYDGLKVARGPDWHYDDQDGDSLYGTIYGEIYDNGWVDVTWENGGYTNAYRIGAEDRYDLYFYVDAIDEEKKQLNKQLNENEKENGKSIKFKKSIPTIREGKRLTGNGVRIKKRRIKVGSGHLSYTAVNTKF